MVAIPDHCHHVVVRPPRVLSNAQPIGRATLELHPETSCGADLRAIGDNSCEALQTHSPPTNFQNRSEGPAISIAFINVRSMGDCTLTIVLATHSPGQREYGHA